MLALILFIITTNSQNITTNDTTTSTPIDITTTSFFTSENIYQTDGTFSPTAQPTPSPVDIPTEEPTKAPTVTIPNNKAKAYKLDTTCYGTDRKQVENNKEFFEEAARESACGDASKEECEVNNIFLKFIFICTHNRIYLSRYQLEK